MSSIFGDLAPLRDRPITASQQLKTAKATYKSIRADPGHELFNSPLVNLSELGISGAPAYALAQTAPYFVSVPGAPETLMARRSVADKLCRVNARCVPVGLELFVFDAWRPAAVQAFFHDQWMPQFLSDLYPGDTEEETAARVTQYWATPSEDASTPSPHSTGGAVDLTLRWIDTGQPLWMGTQFDDAHERSHIDHFERGIDETSFSDVEARASRRLLHWVMMEEGFAPHPNEWWHFSFGDPLWARLNGHDSFPFGAAQPA
ncbi:MAG: M15 family metallopeptidase [Pseudomonadota bacterium]